jgi:hypothetical protein
MDLKQTPVYTPVRLQAQADRLRRDQAQTPSDEIRPSHEPSWIDTVVRQAADRPAIWQTALAFAIPTSQLDRLLDLASATDIEPPVQAAAFQMIQQRLGTRLGPQIWRRFQTDPDHPALVSLFWQFVQRQKARSHRHSHHHTEQRLSFVTLAGRINGSETSAKLPMVWLPEQLLLELVEVELAAQQGSLVLSRYDLDITLPFAQRVLARYFASCPARQYPFNLDCLASWLAQPAVDIWPVANHYYEQIKPLALDDRVGEQVRARLEQAAAQAADPLTPLARKRFEQWQILASLRRTLRQPRLIELISRYYYLLERQAEQVPGAGTFIRMDRLVLVAPTADDYFYLYPRNVFEKTEVSWLLDRETPAAAADESTAPAPWPIEQQFVMPARQALLNEQDKRANERSLIDLLLHNEIISILQLSLIDAHYLFARKVFDELASYKGLSAD